MPDVARPHFTDYYPFALDDFQRHACAALDADRDVLVAAPTGSGKTVVGEYAVHLAVTRGGTCFYTTPIKALSNQKYADLVHRYGRDHVGLLTGDLSVNADAPVVVMTTEVLRNMLYAASPTLRGLRYVVMDEVHYLADRERGPVWEEVIISLPSSVRVVSLSATVSNAEEFGQWLQTVRGATDVVVSEQRPVPLWQHVVAGHRLYDLFVDEQQQRVNNELVRLAREAAQRARAGERRSRSDRRPRPGGRHLVPRRAEVVERLERRGLLPAIVFIFSRAGCDAAVEQTLGSGVRLTTRPEAERIDEVAAAVADQLSPEDRAALGFEAWRAGLRRGVAAHHAGLLPRFKQAVELLFSEGLVKVVYATETLALGINMPARSVVLERLVKWNGETHADITAGEYTQLTGRAGRRGIDVEGHAVVVWHPGFDPTALAGLASTRTYPLRSSFRPSYNMAVNLVHQSERDSARRVLEASFAQFLVDRAAVGQASRRRRLDEAIDGYRAALECDAGDAVEYARLRRRLSDAERAGAARRRAARAESRDAEVARWRVGDIVDIPSGRSRGLAVVLAPAVGHGRTAAPLVLTEARHVRRLTTADLRQVPPRVATVRVPRGFDPSAPAARRSMVSSMRSAVRDAARGDSDRGDHDRGDSAGTGTTAPTDAGGASGGDEVECLRRRLREHPCHRCPDREEHARWGDRLHQAERERDRLAQGLARRQGSLAAAFDRVCAVLDDLGYLDGNTVTPGGQRLRGLFGELDLLAAECLRRGVWDGLRPPELAACVSALTFQSRGPDSPAPAPVPSAPGRAALADMESIGADLRTLEAGRGLSYLREPDLGFARSAYRWTSGHSLASLLADSDLTAGDVVRAMRQVLDTLEQVAACAPPSVARVAREAVRGVRRGVVAYEVPA